MRGQHNRNDNDPLLTGTFTGTQESEHILRIYARNLCVMGHLNDKARAFVFAVLSDAGRQATLSFLLSGYTDKEGQARATHVCRKIAPRNIDGLFAWVEAAIENPANSITEDRLCLQLRDLLSKNIKRGMRQGLRGRLKGMDDVQNLFRLNEDEVALLTTILCYQRHTSFETFCDNTGGVEKFGLLSTLTGVPSTRLRQAGSRHGRLVRCGLVEYPHVERHHFFYGIDAFIAEYLLGLHTEPLGASFYKPGDKGTFPLDAFTLDDSSVRILRTLLSSDTPCSILLYGEPGTGKTEFAKSLADACGKTSSFVLTGEDGENSSRKPALVSAVTTFSPKDAIVVVDEADALLNSRYSFLGFGGKAALRKEWLNEFLDECKAQVVWITNDVSCIEESTLRRFTYAVKFPKYSLRQRMHAWQQHLKGSPLKSVVTPGMVHAFSRDYPVNAAGIANALGAASQVLGAGVADQKAVHETLKSLLASHAKLMGSKPGGNLAHLGQEYDPAAIHASERPEALGQALAAFATGVSRDEQPPANLLFWGMPGTGKTAYAQYLAQSLGLELVIKRASDLLSMWVGGTEHNIRAAFEEAAHEQAILFLDEADSFFIDRQKASHSWENTQTNELLTQMENHHGILICCTNLVDNLDLAAMRRFCWKVKFMPLTNPGKMRLFQKYFMPEGAKASHALRNRIERIPDLTPGDIKAVSLRFRLQGAAKLDYHAILAALEEEAVYKQRGMRVTGFNV